MQVLLSGLLGVKESDVETLMKEIHKRMPDLPFKYLGGVIKPEEELLKELTEETIFVTWDQPITEILLKEPQLKGVVFPSIGYNSCDIETAKKYKVPVCNVPSYCIDEVSNHAIGLLLYLNRKFAIASKVEEYPWGVDHLGSIHRLKGQTLGLIGCGKIGSEVAKKATAFGLTVIAYDPYKSKEELKTSGAKKVEYDTLLTESDYISIHCNLQEDSKNILNANALEKVKPSVYIINTARGGCLEEEALLQGIKIGKVAGAGLDVLTIEELTPIGKRLNQLEEVIITPHCAYLSVEALEEMMSTAAEEVVQLVRGNQPDNLVY